METNYQQTLVKTMSNGGPSYKQITIKQGNIMLTGGGGGYKCSDEIQCKCKLYIDVTIEQKNTIKDKHTCLYNTMVPWGKKKSSY